MDEIMKIQQIFDKQIDRDIQGVIKAEQVEDDIVQQDLEEYVVTNELQKHFNKFFDAYAHSIDTKTDKVGVWISGFFGSGKSHFLKIISYLLENRTIGDRHAIDFFQDKIKDPMVLANMQRVAGIKTDVMLFNIDSKASSNSKSDKEAIMHVFMQVFNDMRGYYGSNLHIADLEESLDNEGKLDTFKAAYQNANSKHESWEKGRKSINLKPKPVVAALLEVGQFESAEMANDWIKSTRSPYAMSIEDFAHKINDYLSTKERNHHVAFLADEMGQYIGDSRDRMLNLQTVTEDLGRLTNGRAWVIVTAQEEIDSLATADTMRMADFSKIQGRFDTRISMSSSNADEVIKRRLLEKESTAAIALKEIYSNRGTSIDNMLHFNDEAERKLYKTKDTFSEVYPFVPYQFNLVGEVLRAIRDNSINGKHQSEGERSMLAMYQDAAQAIKNDEIGKLVSFDMFYNPVDQFLDHMFASVIIRASQNDHINPEHEDDNFNVRVLKTLFLVKYVKNFKTNIENIVSLMVTSIDTDRLILERDVKVALGILERENFIQKNLDVYEFLTDDEQDVNREINQKYVESSELQLEIGTRVFGPLIPLKQPYVLPQLGKLQNNRYIFSFVNMVDDRIIGRSTQTDMQVQIITSFNEMNGDAEKLGMQSIGNNIVIDLPRTATFTDDLRRGKQIEMFISDVNAQKSANNIQSIILAKQTEKEALYDDINIKIKRALDEATIYLNGKPIESTAADFDVRLRQAMNDLIKRVNMKLDHITAAKNKSDLENVLSRKNSGVHFAVDVEENKLALEDVKNYIQLANQVSLKTLKDKFSGAPYAFVEDDINWLVAKLFIDGILTISLNGEILSAMAEDPKQMAEYISKQQYQDKLILGVREAVPNHLKTEVNDVADVYWDRLFTGEDEEIFQGFVRRSKEFIESLKKYSGFGGEYPGTNILSDAIKAFSSIISIKDVNEFFQYVAHQADDLIELYEDGLNDVMAFYGGKNGQKEIWERSLKLTREYEKNAIYLQGDETMAALYEDIKQIRGNINPFKNIKDLKPLNDELDAAFSMRLTTDQEKVIDEIKVRREEATNYLTTSGLDEASVKFSEFLQQIDDAIEGVMNAGDLIAVHTSEQIAKQLTERFEDKIDVVAKGYAPVVSPSTTTSYTVEPTESAIQLSESVEQVVNPKIQKRLNPSKLKNIESSWTIESEDDLNNYIEKLRVSLATELESADIVRFEL
ncbi:BREX system P-loop protein BrxC [Leuconostoc lactis]|nr:BREX system P-loop protein BrxC [Leuconostoc lactis]RYS86138.1 BREX system P-loop protein BrxC [Leuconostoc lactis]